MIRNNERRKFFPIRRKKNVNQSNSVASPLASSLPNSTTSKLSPPLPPLSSHPALVKKQMVKESPETTEHQHFRTRSNTLPRSSKFSLDKVKKFDDAATSLSSSLKEPLPFPKPPAPLPYIPFVPLLEKHAAPGQGKEDEHSHGDVKAMSLSELHSSRHSNLPMQVKVTNGFQGRTRKNTICDGEILNLLCLKKRKLVTIETRTGTKIKVPMNSSLQFGILYNPTNNLKQAVMGFHYKTAGDILSLTVLPKFICATRHHKARLGENAVQKGEILLIDETTTQNQSQRFLACIQVESGKHKKLFEDCFGLFTTQPEHVQMFLPEIISHTDLPQMAVVFFPGKDPSADFISEKEFPLAHQEVVKISTVVSEKSVLATYSSSSRITDPPADLNGRNSSHTVIDIPIDLPELKVQITPPSPSERENIVRLAMELVQGPAANDQHHVRIGNDADIFDAILIDENNDPQQELMFSEPNPPSRRDQLSLDLKLATHDLQMSAQNHSSEPFQTHVCYDPKTFTAVKMENDVQAERNGQTRPDLQQRKAEETSLYALVEAMEKKLQENYDDKQRQIEILREEMAKLCSTLEDLQSQCKQINNQQGVLV